MQLLVGAGIMDVDQSKEEERELFNVAQKVGYHVLIPLFRRCSVLLLL